MKTVLRLIITRYSIAAKARRSNWKCRLYAAAVSDDSRFAQAIPLIKRGRERGDVSWLKVRFGIGRTMHSADLLKDAV